MSVETVRAGGRVAALDQAVEWVSRYFDAEANQRAAAVPKGRPFAFPVYDRLDTGSGPDELSDGDLLAPALLNVPPKLSAVFNLQAARAELEAVLASIPLGLSLQDAVAVGAHIEPLQRLGALLDGRASLRGVRGTILMKVMHRKRPLFLPLYDTQVFACYCGSGAEYPIERSSKRTWARFFQLLGEAMALDLNDQPDAWKALSGCAPEDVSVLRILDVVAWNLGGGNSAEAIDGSDG